MIDAELRFEISLALQVHDAYRTITRAELQQIA